MSALEDRVASRRNRLGLGYLLVGVENLMALLWPFAIGLAIDGLLDDRWGGLVFFVVLALGHTAVGVLRQRYESRTFNQLYAAVATDLVDQQRGAGVDVASVTGRTGLAGEYVEFLQFDIPAAITSGFTVIGSLVMLFLYDPTVGVAAAALALPVLLINRRLMFRSRRLYRDLNDLAEVEVDVIGRGRRTESTRHFGQVSSRWIRLSDAEATSWGLVEALSVALWVWALVQAVTGDLDLGGVIGLLAYVWSYTAGFDEVPGVLQRLSRLPDIKRRLAEGDPTR